MDRGPLFGSCAGAWRFATGRRQRWEYARVVEFSVLGPLRVTEGDDEIVIRKGISRRLLLALLLQSRDVVSSSALMDLLWGEDLPQNPANALQIQISYLRRTLAAGSTGGAQPIQTRAGGYAIDVAPEQLDLHRFEQLVAALPSDIVTSDPTEITGMLHGADEALRLWRGEALADVAGEPFVAGTITRLEEMRWRCVETRLDLLLLLGRHREVTETASDLLVSEPLRERLYEQLMLALYRSGRQADALAAYDRAREHLLDELGLDPGPKLQKLQVAVLAQDPALDLVHLERPEPASQPEAADRPSPPPSLLTNVPLPATELIGRGSELARIGEMTERHRMVTLTGPGGAGKTRLAVELARVGPCCTVWFVDLGAIEMPDLVAQTVAVAIGAKIGPGQDPAESIAAMLSTECGMLVLDTCEHVLGAAGHVASAVLRRTADVKVLATSRRALGISGEVAWPVPPLGIAPPDATDPDEIAAAASVQLFCARARAVRPDFTLTADNAADVAAICAALDGLPLAIELAAARVDVFEPATIRSRLRDRFELLIDGAADVSARQQTLRGTIEWSIDLLSDAQRACFARLGVFAGGFDLDAACAIGSDRDDHARDDEVLDLLAGLVRHSVVVRDGPDRFRLLDTLRVYAGDLLADLDADETRRRHALHYTGVAEALELAIRGINQGEALSRLRAEIANFRAAAEWSVVVGDLDIATRLSGALAWFWTLDGHLDIANHHLRQAVEFTNAPPAARAKVLWGYSLLVASLGDLDEALDAGRRSTDLAREAGDDAAIGAGLNAVAVAQWALGDIAGSIASHDEAIDRFVAANDIWGESVCRTLRARTALDIAAPEAHDLLAAAVDAAERSRDAHVIALALGLVAQRHERNGDLTAALGNAQESLRLHDSIGYLEGTISALHLLARLATKLDDHDAACAHLCRALRLGRKMQHAAAICEALEGLAVLAHRESDHERAARILAATDIERASRKLSIRPDDAAALDAVRTDVYGSDYGRRVTVEELVDEILADAR